MTAPAGTHVTCDVDRGSSSVPGHESCSPCGGSPHEPLDIGWVLLDLQFVLDHWDDLTEAHMPGTPRPWRQPLLDPERQAELAARDRAERQTRDPDAPGFTRAPLHVDILDLTAELHALVLGLVEPIGKQLLRMVPGKDRDERTLSSNTTLPPRHQRRAGEIPEAIRFLRTWLPHAAEHAWPLPTQATGRRLHRACREIQRVLSLMRGGQLLPGAVCPWCRGVTPRTPAGGATTLRVEEIERERAANEFRPHVPALYAVVCWNPMCDPPAADCGTRWRGRPTWPVHEWDWLAQRLLAPDLTAAAAPEAIAPMAIAAAAAG